MLGEVGDAALLARLARENYDDPWIQSAVLSSAAGPVENILIARYTPSRYHGLGFGAKFVVAFGAGPLAILLIAWVRETTGSLEILFLGLAATSVVITLVALLLPGADRARADAYLVERAAL